MILYSYFVKLYFFSFLSPILSYWESLIVETDVPNFVLAIESHCIRECWSETVIYILMYFINYLSYESLYILYKYLIWSTFLQVYNKLLKTYLFNTHWTKEKTHKKKERFQRVYLYIMKLLSYFMYYFYTVIFRSYVSQIQDR